MSSDYPTRSAYDGGDRGPVPAVVPYPRIWPLDGSVPQSPQTGTTYPAANYPEASYPQPSNPQVGYPPGTYLPVNNPQVGYPPAGNPQASYPQTTSPYPQTPYPAWDAAGMMAPAMPPPAAAAPPQYPVAQYPVAWAPPRTGAQPVAWAPPPTGAQPVAGYPGSAGFAAAPPAAPPAGPRPSPYGAPGTSPGPSGRDDRRDDLREERWEDERRDRERESKSLRSERDRDWNERSNDGSSRWVDEDERGFRGEQGWTPHLGRYKFQVRSLRIVWSTIFFSVIFLPLVLAPRAGGELRPWSRGGIAIELCLTTGLLGLSTLAATVILPSRMRTILKAFGIEGVLNSHKLLALVTTGLVLIHVAFVAVDRPANVALLWPVTGPPRARAGEVAALAMILLCWLSLRRRSMGTRYELWRMGHALLAVGAIAGTYVHIYFLNHLMQDVAERSVFLAILFFIIGVFANRWILRPLRAQRRAYVIKEIRSETPSTSTMVLTAARRGQRILKYRAGQFAWIRLDSPFGPLQGHPFTIASAPNNTRELHFTIRNAGDFTGSVTVLTPGRKVFVDGPYGDFNDDHLNCKSLLLISGGIGITPMMSLLRAHAHRRDRRPHVLMNCARSESELMFRDELRHLETILNLKVIEVLSKPPGGWRGVSGRLDEEILADVLDQHGLRMPGVFICGPPAMMKDTRAALNEVGVDDKHIHTEDFAMV